MSVRVVARIRPLLDQELDKDIIVHGESTEEGKPATIVKIPNPKNGSEEFSFTFNSVYDRDTSQEMLFTAEVAPHLKSLFQGLDVTIFAYGVTGTGKTHTMRGGLKLAERGVIPRLLSGVFRRSKKIMKDTDGETTVHVDLSYYEIYNDKVFDLLESPDKRLPAGLPLREKDGKTIVVGLTERPCQDLRDFEKMYIEANNNRITAATKLNAHSSRSHAILKVKLTQTTGDTVRVSTASAIDLAGSEDNRRTENNKERLIESAAINKSLFVLSQCVDAISRGDKRIPYRESKMTRILSLGQNNGITIMILNLSPLRSYHLDTLSSLNVSSRAKRIEVREIENEVVFKQVPRASSTLSGGAAQRQPLRPLANVHNVHSGAAAAAAAKAADTSRPAKAFSVFVDRAKPAPVARPAAANTSQMRMPSSTRRSNGAELAIPRPAGAVSKIARPGNAGAKTMSISAADIEAMVEKKVSEILASRAAEQPEPAPALTVAVQSEGINEAVQRRLDALERRIEEENRRGEDGRSDGLKCLLAARQAKERGDDVGALAMYEMALPFFPGQAKLMGKIERLRAKLGVSEEADVRATSEHQRAEGRKRRAAQADDDDDYAADEADDDESVVGGSTPRLKTRKRRAMVVFEDEGAPATPRGKQLLDIINSRDAMRIKGLSGFGPKKARDLVEYLEMLPEGEAGQIASLGRLRLVPGMGGKAIERACEGIGGSIAV
ncbi:related to chromokinesin Xkid [Cephalotrichum gorgonifer]|uniref:Related to chromokinesin Xkid n=1 Tax=Cephalotrichum gorgonifer TaxID=2041049 RepID=A0AAE8MY45_9PEZI|nr:related to chromokinesin Xkid [Cephalotrichum gorgonifer]